MRLRVDYDPTPIDTISVKGSVIGNIDQDILLPGIDNAIANKIKILVIFGC